MMGVILFDFVLITSSYGMDPHASLQQKENELVRWAMFSVSNTTAFLVVNWLIVILTYPEVLQT